MSKRVTVQFPNWMIDNIIGQDCENQAERVRELVQKGSMVETLEDATGESLRQMVSSENHRTEGSGSGPTGYYTYQPGSTRTKTHQDHMDIATSPTYNRETPATH